LQDLEEHKSIVAALEKLLAAAKKANKVEYVEFAKEPMHHGQTEQEVSYIHYVEGMYETAMNPASGHYPEGATVPH